MKPLSRTDFEDQFFMGVGESATRTIAGCDTRAAVDTAELWIYASYEAILYGMPDYAVHNARPPLV